VKLLLDMNLSPEWVGRLRAHGIEALHWSNVGVATADDRTLLSWARTHGFVLLTHDLDFSAIWPLHPNHRPAYFSSACTI
jgi:predicted nuclease of predicted toxin-antitoxin system